MSIQVLMVAGEASADLHGSSLLRALQRLEPDLTCFGVGGRELAGAGMDILVPAESLSVVGIADWLGRWREIVGSYRRVCGAALDRRPDCAILLDLPDFNLKLAARLHAEGIPIIYYISPQVWAWRQYRVKKIQKFVDHMLVVFPFEREFYRRRSIDVEFVGHPLLERIERKGCFRTQVEIESAPRIAVLPGSRRSELNYHGPLLRETIIRLRRRFPSAVFRVPVASTLTSSLVQDAFADSGLEVVEERASRILSWADIALVASGTAALETALVGTPFCLFYVVSRSSGWILEHILKYRSFFGMPNLLHGKEVVKEFIQKKATAKNLTDEATKLILDEKYRQEISSSLAQCRSLLGHPGASERAAQAVQRVLARKRVLTC